MKKKTINECKQVIEKYFNNCETEEKIATVSGLAFNLNTTRLKLLSNNNGKFNSIIEKALTRCEAYIEERLVLGKNASGLMFILKNNFSWNEKLNTESNEANLEIIINHPWGKKEENQSDHSH